MSKVSVIIPARDDASALCRAVASVLAQEGAVIDEIAIAVGPSTDGTLDEARRLASLHPTVAVLENPEGLTPTALNRAIAATTGNVIVRVDARSELPIDYVANALDALNETGAGNIGAVQKPVGHTAVERSIAAAMRSRVGSGGARYRHATQRVRADTGYLGVFRRDAVDEVGGFDESFVRNQDSELNIRLRKAGLEVWVDPRLVVSYRPRPTLKALASQYWQYGWWRARTIASHMSSMRARQAVVPVAVVALGASIVLSLAVDAAFWAIPGAYGVVLVSAVIIDGRGLDLRERSTMIAALVVMHLAWGLGFVVSATKLAAARLMP